MTVPQKADERRRWSDLLQYQFPENTTRFMVCRDHLPEEAFVKARRRKHSAPAAVGFAAVPPTEPAPLPQVPVEDDDWHFLGLADSDDEAGGQTKRPRVQKEHNYFLVESKAFEGFKFCPVCGNEIEQLNISNEGAALTLQYRCSPACSGFQCSRGVVDASGKTVKNINLDMASACTVVGLSPSASSLTS